MITISDWIKSPVTSHRSQFAIGDIHGRLDLLTDLDWAIENIVKEDTLENPLRVYLGDYISRGPHQLETLQYFADRQQSGNSGALEDEWLMGNHDQWIYMGMFGRDFHSINQALGDWFVNDSQSGVNALIPHCDCISMMAKPRTAAEINDLFVTNFFKPNIVNFFKNLKPYYCQDQNLYVHAGINPMKDLSRQLAVHPSNYVECEWCWIRNPFLNWEAPFENNWFVIHGHTIRTQPELKSNRLGIDTGAYKTGTMTAVEFRGDKLRYIQSSAE